MKLSKKDSDIVVRRYTERFMKFGISPMTLGWNKGKQFLRFGILTSFFDLNNKSVLDIGCGFGDAINYFDKIFKNYKYNGVDLVSQLVFTAKEKHPEHTFYCTDFLKMKIKRKYDFAIGSGIFNFKLQESDNYRYIDNVIKKSLEIVNEAVAFDFLSDKVDYRYEHTFHSSPEKILGIAYKYSKNVILRNDYMPFEFSLIIFKDQSFNISDTIFSQFKRIYKRKRKKLIVKSSSKKPNQL
jgi:SAM-dependent methyltransferase